MRKKGGGVPDLTTPRFFRNSARDGDLKGERSQKETSQRDEKNQTAGVIPLPAHQNNETPAV